jgi:anaerobic selenocysteine-containing dehydrogenase
MNILILRQNNEFDKIYKDLLINNKKTKHWAWWIWPTEKQGYSEPLIKGLGSYIEANKINKLLKNTNVKKWTEILNKINELITDKKSVSKVIPTIDHGRIRAFFTLFLNNNNNNKNKKFYKAIIRQKELFDIY